MPFSERYGQRFEYRANVVRESRASLINEHLVQCIWYDRLFCQDTLQTIDARKLKVIPPGC